MQEAFLHHLDNGERVYYAGSHQSISHIISAKVLQILEKMQSLKAHGLITARCEIQLPASWNKFVNSEKNKRDLTTFLSKELIGKARALPPEYTLIVAWGLENDEQV